MANMGFSRLILSDPKTSDLDTARKVAVSAGKIIDQVQITSSLKEAAIASGASFLIGTTRRDRKYRDTPDLNSAATEILRMASCGGVAILFGPEDRGLENQEVALCRLTVTIPSQGELASYNLSHAAAIVLYTLMTASFPVRSTSKKAVAGFSDLEGMFGHVEDLLVETGFIVSGNTDHMMQAVRKFIHRAEPTAREVKMIRGICRQILWRLGKNGS